MNTNTMNPFRKTDATDSGAIKFYGKAGATWEQMESFLRKLFRNDPHMEWMGYGEEGTEDFKVVVVRKSCTPYRCKKQACDGCCEEVCVDFLAENEAGENMCESCLEQDEDDCGGCDGENNCECYECGECGTRSPEDAVEGWVIGKDYTETYCADCSKDEEKPCCLCENWTTSEYSPHPVVEVVHDEVVCKKCYDLRVCPAVEMTAAA
jgi:hypothetical protein